MEDITKWLIILAKNPYSKCIIGIMFIISMYHILFPPLTNKLVQNLNPVLYYQYWRYSTRSNYNEEKLYVFAKEEILKNKDGEKILEIFNQLDRNQNITITQNKNNENVYFFTNSKKYKSEITVYKKEGENLVFDKKFSVWHPYKVGYGEYDEDNQKIYLGVIRICLHERDFLGKWINGASIVNANFWIFISKLLAIRN